MREPSSSPSRTSTSSEPSSDETFELTPKELVLGVYRFFYNKKVGLLLILAMGFLALLGVLFQQIPDELRTDPASVTAWIESVRPWYRGWTPILAKLGVFHIFSSLWFKLAIGLFVVSIVACTLHRTPLLLGHATRPHTKVKESFFEHGRLHETVYSDLPADAAMARARDLFKSKGYRLVASSEGASLNLFADRFRFAPFGTVFAHAAFVIILLGVLVTSTGGFRNNSFTVPVGGRADIGHNTGLAVEARSFTDSYHADGKPKDYVSDLVLYKDGKQVAARAVRVNTPIRYEGVSINQSNFGIAADIVVKDTDGKSLYQGSVPLQNVSRDGQTTYGNFALPNKKVRIFVLTAKSGATAATVGPGKARVDIVRDGEEEPSASRQLTQGQPAQVGDLAVTFERERQFTGLMVSRDPGAMWVWIGSGLLVLGTCVTMFLRHRRVWVRVHECEEGGSTVRLACPDRADIVFERRFREFADSMANAAEPETDIKTTETESKATGPNSCKDIIDA